MLTVSKKNTFENYHVDRCSTHFPQTVKVNQIFGLCQRTEFMCVNKTSLSLYCIHLFVSRYPWDQTSTSFSTSALTPVLYYFGLSVGTISFSVVGGRVMTGPQSTDVLRWCLTGQVRPPRLGPGPWSDHPDLRTTSGGEEEDLRRRGDLKKGC